MRPRLNKFGLRNERVVTYHYKEKQTRPASPKKSQKEITKNNDLLAHFVPENNDNDENSQKI